MAEFKLECKCGSNKFHVVRGVETEDISLVCESCSEPIATCRGYSVNWVEEMEAVDAEATD